MEELNFKTSARKQVLDITGEVEKHLPKKSGLCHLFILHTTASLTTADLDPGTDLDMLDAFEALMPKLAYRHPHDPAHVTDHILSSIIGASLTLPVEAGRLQLGEWQRVVLIELDGPRTRNVIMNFGELSASARHTIRLGGWMNADRALHVHQIDTGCYGGFPACRQAGARKSRRITRRSFSAGGYVIGTTGLPVGIHLSDESDARAAGHVCVALTLMAIAIFWLTLKLFFSSAGVSVEQIQQIKPADIQQLLQ